MTRRARLEKLEAARQATASGAGVFTADVAAGLWQEVGAGGRVFLLEGDEGPEGVRAAGCGVLLFSPGGPSKVLAGVRWGDL